MVALAAPIVIGVLAPVLGLATAQVRLEEALGHAKGQPLTFAVSEHDWVDGVGSGQDNTDGTRPQREMRTWDCSLASLWLFAQSQAHYGLQRLQTCQ
eukprot:m.76898 g.76898  ORF g.76898 m.76898 type:complete len:97 (+) comp14442_c2_seq16:1256-1546(+)